jgi:DNA-binding transcriptional MerR regulator
MSKKLKMKDLERATGVGREAIRFYIREGLLPEPERPARNVAWYDESFIERILLVKKLQTERYLPLSVIKGVVAGDQTPTPDEVQTLIDLHGRLRSNESGDAVRIPEKLSGLAKRVGLPVREILAMAKVEAVAVVTRDGDQWLEGPDLSVVEVWADSRRAGFDEAAGFSATTLRMYVEFCRWLVREELRNFTSTVTGKVDPERVQRMAETGIVNSGQLLRFIHERVLTDAIAHGNLPQTDLERGQRDAAVE